jgi:hypothetical protein
MWHAVVAASFVAFPVLISAFQEEDALAGVWRGLFWLALVMVADLISPVRLVTIAAFGLLSAVLLEIVGEFNSGGISFFYFLFLLLTGALWVRKYLVVRL